MFLGGRNFISISFSLDFLFFEKNHQRKRKEKRNETRGKSLIQGMRYDQNTENSFLLRSGEK